MEAFHVGLKKFLATVEREEGIRPEGTVQAALRSMLTAALRAHEELEGRVVALEVLTSAENVIAQVNKKLDEILKVLKETA